ncbi:MAG: sigma-70 family RNA polymerase sigma factor [Planctomycetota bacterium]|nr:sigma-70 family RNA polymerase sigma factor [Planctomycetota bacterium]
MIPDQRLAKIRRISGHNGGRPYIVPMSGKRTMDNRRLLEEYAQSGREEPFRKLVERHINLVYSSALRQTRNPDLAEDVTQAVFILMAQRAKKLSSAVVLSGWLYKATHYTVLNIMKMEHRRKQHELRAAKLADAPAPQPQPWEELRPVLDSAMARLDETSRNAILLRFFEGKSVKETGQVLAMSENAAAKRIGRALTKLRGYLGKEGVALPTGMLAGLISANAVESAPGQLAAAVCTEAMAAVGVACAAAGSLALAEATASIMCWAKLKALLLTPLIVLGVIATAIVVKPMAVRMFESRQTSRLPVAVKALPSLPPRPPTSQPWSLGGVPRYVAAPRWAQYMSMPREPEIGRIISPLSIDATLYRAKPDGGGADEIVCRVWEDFALLRFDVSGLSRPPEKSVLKACVYGIENTGGYLAPARLILHRVRTDWDETATTAWAKKATSQPWAAGPRFAATSPADLDPTPVAVVEVPNPPPPGYNVEADITPLVRDWASGKYPNYGLLIRADFARGYSYQANIANRLYTQEFLPRIVSLPANEKPERSQP